MMEDKLIIQYISHDEECSLPFDEYCKQLAKRNQVVLHKLEEYLGVSLKDVPELKEVRSLILSVAGDTERIPENICSEVK